MGKRYLLDTNAISKGLRGLFPDLGQQLVSSVLAIESNFSVISRIELLGFNPNDEQTERAFKLFVEQGNEFGLTEDIIQQTIAIRRTVKIKLPDAIIAATAIVHGLTLLSDNDADFLRVPRLSYINPAKR